MSVSGATDARAGGIDGEAVAVSVRGATDTRAGGIDGEDAIARAGGATDACVGGIEGARSFAYSLKLCRDSTRGADRPGQGLGFLVDGPRAIRRRRPVDGLVPHRPAQDARHRLARGLRPERLEQRGQLGDRLGTARRILLRGTSG